MRTQGNTWTWIFYSNTLGCTTRHLLVYNSRNEVAMSGKTLARVIIAILGGIAVGGVAWLAAGPRPFLPPLPPPPMITAPRGSLPTGVVAFEEQIQTDAGYDLLGSGFMLELPNGEVIGVTTAHSLAGRNLPMSFTMAGPGDPVATFSRLQVPPGQPRTGADMTVDYALLRPDVPPAPALVLRPDLRSAPQPGERVLLYSGLGDGRGGQRVLPGTVESVDGNGVWVRMDSIFDPGLMSGSPVLSQHTGRVVGMAIAMSWKPGVLSIGINPVGVILRKAMSR